MLDHVLFELFPVEGRVGEGRDGNRGPRGSRPGPHEKRSPGRRKEMIHECGPDPLMLMRRAHVSVTDQRDILHILDTHDPHQSFVQVEPLKAHSPVHFP